ncbi:tRNA guanosine(34) transglycosylase Tgt [Chondromyces apiculatus]|uniref:Queuine tRNA-ribosyltransferase n=1 Tax=Chondromyces apiculatus DSM 436 TaxID=1192034 RepID=A0A017T059_9BACT|nr:tRNA guanosine(34) transglycosylase Tgt [Chondromyces apiculatus]EYF02397.1 tRNA-guanine transglycosylase [Chondromyces apiculatus DSM 436]
MHSPGYSFRETSRDGNARTGLLVTPHGEVETPTFMPVGTQGSVKTLSPTEVAATGARIVLGNTYHLWIRPGPDIIARAGGLHKFASWPHVMLTDSGGFQAFSLADRRTMTEDGFVFRSHIDGSRLALSPEVAMEVQGKIGADIAMQLDVCPPGMSARPELERACATTTRWARRCLAAKRPDQALFGIVQGGTDVALRKAHAEELAAMPFDGLALGGFSVGEPIERMHEVLGEVAPTLDRARPHYLMGVGTPSDLVRAIGTGVDMFDCVLPTRNARNGQALTQRGRIVIKQARYKEDFTPLDPTCSCPACTGGYTRAYLRHLYLAGEILVLRLITEHNLHLYGRLVREAREAIAAGRYASFARAWLGSDGDEP